MAHATVNRPSLTSRPWSAARAAWAALPEADRQVIRDHVAACPPLSPAQAATISAVAAPARQAA